MDIDELKKGVESVSESLDAIQENLCNDFEGLSLEDVGDRLSAAESDLGDLTCYTGRGMAASDRIAELVNEFAELEEEKESLEEKVRELEERIKELEDGQ